MIEDRSSIVEVRMKIRFESRELRSSIKWNLTHIGLSRKSRNAGLVNPYIFDWLNQACQARATRFTKGTVLLKHGDEVKL